MALAAGGSTSWERAYTDVTGTSTLAVTHGFDGADRFDDTFQYDLSAETWMRVAVPSTFPALRVLARAW